MQIPARTLSALAIIVASPLAPAHAQALHDRFWLEASLYRPHIDSSVSMTSKANPAVGTEIDMEEENIASSVMNRYMPMSTKDA